MKRAQKKTKKRLRVKQSFQPQLEGWGRFKEQIGELAGSSSPLLRKLLLEEWQRAFGEKVFPDRQTSLDIYLAICYKTEMKKLTLEGREVTERFAHNYNQAIRFGGMMDMSLYRSLKLKWKEGVEQMAAKKKAKKKAAAKREAKGPRTNTQRYTVCSCFKAGLSVAQTIAKVKQKHGKEITPSYLSMFRSYYNAGKYTNIGFPAPKVPLVGDKKKAAKKAGTKAAKKSPAKKKKLKLK